MMKKVNLEKSRDTKPRVLKSKKPQRIAGLPVSTRTRLFLNSTW